MSDTNEPPAPLCRVCRKGPATRTTRWGRMRYALAVCEVCKAELERKNLYMPCIIGDRLDDMAPEERARVIRRTYWADNITNAEWPVVLRHEGVKAYVRSKLKKKAVGWVMALSRIIWLNPELGVQVLREADALYREQIEEEPPIRWAVLADRVEIWLQSDGNEEDDR